MDGSAAALDRCTTCTRAPCSAAMSSSPAIATSSASCGRERQEAGVRRPGARRRRGRGRRRPRRARSAARRARRPRPARGPARPTDSGGNSGTPLSTRKHLKPKTPASRSAARPPREAGTAPPQKPTSTWHFPAAASRLVSSAATSTVAGTEFSGMSTSVVTPPAAAARVAERKPSHSVRPGSLTCTWVSTSPGSSTSSSASVTCSAAPASAPGGRDLHHPARRGPAPSPGGARRPAARSR